MELRIRDAQSADLAGVLRLYRQLHVNDEVIDPEAAASVWQAIQDSRNRTVLVAEADTGVAGVPVGTLEYLIWPNLTRGGRSFAVVENVVVDEGFRRKGVGRLLIATAVAAAIAQGCYKVQLSASEPSAIEFYRAVGFSALAQSMRMYIRGM